MKHLNSAMAKKQAIKNYHYYCIMTGQLGGVVGAHIYSAGAYQELACYDENVVPIVPRLHTTGDNTLEWITYQVKERDPIDGIKYLIDQENGCRSEFSPQFKKQLLLLSNIMSDIKRLKNDAEIIEQLIWERWP